MWTADQIALELINAHATYLSVLVLVEGQGVGAVLIMIDTVLSLLTQLEELADGSLHHHLLAPRANAGDVTLCVYYQYLEKYHPK